MRKIKINKKGKKRTIEDVKEELSKVEEKVSVEDMGDRMKTTKKATAKAAPVKPKPEVKPEPTPKRRTDAQEESLPEPESEQLDLVTEQMEKSDMTTYSPDAETNVKKIKKNPERYIEINMIKKSRLVDTFFIFADKKTFMYRKKKYHIIEDVVYLLPKRGYFIPTCFYREGYEKPVGFRQTNKGITGKALSLLYRHQLYETLLRTEDKSMNIFIIIFNLATLIIFGVALYFLYAEPPPEVPLYEAVIMPLRGLF